MIIVTAVVMTVMVVIAVVTVTKLRCLLTRTSRKTDRRFDLHKPVLFTDCSPCEISAFSQKNC